MRTKLRSKVTLLFIVCAALLAVGGTAMAITADPGGTTAPAPTIQSDKADYAPGELVTLTGGGWQPGESVNIKVNDTYGASWSRNVDVTADASGNVTDSFNLPDWFVSDYDVTATGAQSGTATTTFTDGNVSVSGTVTDSATNQPISGATVTCTTSSGCNANFSATTNASGNYVFSQPTGNRLTFDTNGPVTLTLTVSKLPGYTNGTITLANVNNSDNLTGKNVALVPATKKLTVTKTGAGTGTVTSSPSGISCGATCSADFNNGTIVTLTAAPGANSTFNGWSGDGTGTTTRTVTMDADKSVSALFKANQAALNYTGPTSGTFGDKLTLSSSGGSGTGALTYDVGSSTACALGTGADAGKLLITSGTGTCSVTVNKAADGDYNSATSGPQTISLSKANQAALTVDDPDEGTFGDHLPIVTSGGTTNGALSFDTGTSTACQIDANNKLEITSGTGTCSVTATMAGNANYNSVTSQPHSVTVQKADQAALTVDDPDSGTFGQHLAIVTSGGSGTGALSFQASGGACQIDNDNKLEITSGTGSCSVTATKAADNNYNSATSAAHSVTVNKANQAALTVTSPNSGTFGEHLTITTSGGTTNGALSFQANGTACQIDANNKLEITSGTGSCSVTATMAGNANYNDVTSSAHSVTVNKATAQVTLSNLGPHVYDGTAKAATVATTPTGLNVTVTYNGSTTAPIAVGSYSVVATVNNPNYQGQATGTLVISPWTFRGFYQPVDMDTATTEALNTVKAGSTVPLKFEVFSGTTELTNTSAIKGFSTKAVACPSTSFVADEIEFLTTGGTSLRYDTTAGQFIQNWQTPKKVGCHDVTMETQDGSKLVAHFQLR